MCCTTSRRLCSPYLRFRLNPAGRTKHDYCLSRAASLHVRILSATATPLYVDTVAPATWGHSRSLARVCVVESASRHADCWDSCPYGRADRLGSVWQATDSLYAQPRGGGGGHNERGGPRNSLSGWGSGRRQGVCRVATCRSSC